MSTTLDPGNATATFFNATSEDAVAALAAMTPAAIVDVLKAGAVDQLALAKAIQSLAARLVALEAIVNAP
jgi:hypothetical protein